MTKKQTIKPAKPKHAVKVAEDTKDVMFARRYGGKWVASCACGWASARSTEDRAASDAQAHERASV